MKHFLYAKIIFFMFVVLSFSTSTARILPQDQDDKEVKTNSTTLHEASLMKLQEDDIFHLMGLEECNEKDEECERRRMIAEAHLDYIYTQHHKPKALP